MSIKNYQFYCDYCGYKRLTDGSDVQDLVPVKQCPVPAGVPYLDPVTKKIVTPKAFNRPKKFKCPKCGRVITARKIVTETNPDAEKDWLA